MEPILQFLSEAVLISVTGGLIGVVLGIIISKTITQIAEIYTIVSPFSVLIAFFVSGHCGDPIGWLRYGSEHAPSSGSSSWNASSVQPAWSR